MQHYKTNGVSAQYHLLPIAVSSILDENESSSSKSEQIQCNYFLCRQYPYVDLYIYTLEERKRRMTMYMHNIKGECKCYIGNFKEFFTLKVGVHTYTLLRNHSAWTLYLHKVDVHFRLRHSPHYRLGVRSVVFYSWRKMNAACSVHFPSNRQTVRRKRMEPIIVKWFR